MQPFIAKFFFPFSYYFKIRTAIYKSSNQNEILLIKLVDFFFPNNCSGVILSHFSGLLAAAEVMCEFVFFIYFNGMKTIRYTLEYLVLNFVCNRNFTVDL